MRRLQFYVYFIIIAGLVMLSSCSITRRVPPGEHLLIDNEINIDNQSIDKDDLSSIIKQKPNRKILFIWRFHLRVYNLAANGREGKFWQYLRNTVGEKPVLLDSVQTRRSASQLRLYLHKKGYFDAIVRDTTRIIGMDDDGSGKDRAKARVVYNIETGDPYTVRNLSYEIPDPFVNRIIEQNETQRLLKPGDVYDEDVMVAERERITNLLRNDGMYYFTRDYFYYTVDSALPGRQVDVRMHLTLPYSVNRRDTQYIHHQRYYLNNVYVITDYEPGVEKNYNDTLVYGGLTFLYNDELNIKPAVISQHSFLKPQDIFQQRNSDETYKKLIELRIFRSVNVSFSEPPEQSGMQNKLDAYLHLSPMTRQSVDFEAEGSNRAGNLGIGGSVFYTNRNSFKGGELIEFRMQGGLEAQKYDSAAVKEDDDKLFFFNTIEFGPELSLTLPRFPLIRPERISKYFTPKTTLTAGYNYQSQPAFSRRIINSRFGFNWREFSSKQHNLNLIDVNFVKINPKEDFSIFLDQIQNELIRRTYTNHLTAGSNYTFTLNSRKQLHQVTGHYFFFRGGIDIGGNTLYLASLLTGADTTDGSYQIFGVPFAQFAKVDADLRYYRILHEKHNLAFRIATGVGVPYLNLNVLPLEKSYFIGGANSLRAWAARSLGPGSFNPGPGSTNTLRIGDMNLEANMEYRFDLFRILEGTWFLDAGNIWLVKDDPTRTEGEFSIRRFHKEIAVGSGVGVRFDFTYFIFRVDLGVKVRDPMLPEEERWMLPRIFDTDWKEEYRLEHGAPYNFTNINLGIGYPF